MAPDQSVLDPKVRVTYRIARDSTVGRSHGLHPLRPNPTPAGFDAGNAGHVDAMTTGQRAAETRQIDRPSFANRIMPLNHIQAVDPDMFGDALRVIERRQCIEVRVIHRAMERAGDIHGVAHYSPITFTTTRLRR